MIKCILTNFRTFYTNFPIKGILFKFYKVFKEISIIFGGIVLYFILKIWKVDS